MKINLTARRFITQNEECIIGRSLPEPGKITTKKGSEVSPDVILGESEVSQGFRSLPVAEILSVNPKKVAKYLLKKVGDKVFFGEPIARRFRFFGRVKKEVASPTSGTVVAIDANGSVNIEFRPEAQKLLAGVWGKVEAVHKNQTVDIRAQASQIYGVAGAGRVREGIIRIMCEREEFLLPQAINEKLSGSILVGGALVSRAALSKAVAVGVSGICAGGMHARDFWEAGGARQSAFWTSSDVGVTLVILQGFGLVAPSQEMYDFLKAHDGRFAIIDGDLAKVIIPEKEGKGEKEEEAPKEKEVKVGVKVRILDLAHFGEFGTVSEIAKTPKKLFSQDSFQLIVETKHGTIEIPHQNAEIII